MQTQIDCPQCDGRGKTYTSCCGDDMYPHQDVPLCPTCKEWQGDESDQAERCEDCEGTGKVAALPS